MIQEKPNTAIVVLTLHEDEYDVRKLFKAGARGFVLKKSAGTELTKAVLAVHGGGKYADPAMAQVLAMNSANEAQKAGPGRVRASHVLMAREREFFGHIAAAYTNKEIAGMLGLSDRTVETHRLNSMGKLVPKNRAERVRYAIREDLLKAG